MSSITTIRDKSGRAIKYRARYRTPDGASRSQTFNKKAAAEAFLNSTEHRKLNDEYVDTSAGRITFGAYARDWAERQPHRATTSESIEAILRRHILPTFEARPISSIRTSEVQAWVVSLGTPTHNEEGEIVKSALSPTTIALVYGKLAGIMRSAVDDQRIVRTPCTRGVKLPRQDGAEVVLMSPEQVVAIADAVPARYRALVVLIAGTGARPGEALGLTVDRVDWLRRRIRIDRQLITVAKSVPTFGPTKTASSVRTVAAPQVVLDELSQHIAHHGAGPGGLIFTDTKGDPIRRNALGHVWRRAAAEAGVEAYSWHDLRHYAASVMIHQGASVKAVQRQLGHASATTTLDVYAHLWPDAEDTTRAALDAGLTRFVSSSCHDVSHRQAN